MRIGVGMSPRGAVQLAIAGVARKAGDTVMVHPFAAAVAMPVVTGGVRPDHSRTVHRSPMPVVGDIDRCHSADRDRYPGFRPR